MNYRHTWLTTQIVAFLRGYGNINQVSSVYPTPDGAVVVLEDTTNGVVYRLRLDKVPTPAGEITPQKIINDGGF